MTLSLSAARVSEITKATLLGRPRIWGPLLPRLVFVFLSAQTLLADLPSANASELQVSERLLAIEMAEEAIRRRFPQNYVQLTGSQLHAGNRYLIYILHGSPDDTSPVPAVCLERFPLRVIEVRLIYDGETPKLCTGD